MMGTSAKYWSDILVAILEIESFVAGIDGLNAYIADKRTKRAVERNLATVGEAVGHLRKLTDDAASLGSANAIVGMRNRLIHSYDNVDDRIVWEVVRKHLPLLKAEAERQVKLRE